MTSNINVWEKQIEWALGLRYKTIYSCGYLTKLFFFFCKWAFSKPNRLYKKFFYIITFILYGDLSLTLLWNPLSQNDLYHTLIKWSMTNPAIYIRYQKEKNNDQVCLIIISKRSWSRIKTNYDIRQQKRSLGLLENCSFF